MGFEQIKWVLDNSRAENGTLLVALALARYMDDDGICWPHQETIAAQTRLKDRRVRECIAELINLGELEKVRTQQGNRYRLNGTTVPVANRHHSAGPRVEVVEVGSETDVVGDISVSPSFAVSEDAHEQASFLPDPIDEAWTLYVTLLEKPRMTLTPQRRRWIRNAHEACGVEQTQQAIRGLAASEYHRTHGYTDLSYAIAPKSGRSIDGQIEMMASKAPATRNPYDALTVDELVASFDAESEDMIWEWISDINRWALRPNDQTQPQAERQIARFRNSGFEVLIVEGRVAGARTIA
jgi:hypothetical protein